MRTKIGAATQSTYMITKMAITDTRSELEPPGQMVPININTITSIKIDLEITDSEWILGGSDGS